MLVLREPPALLDADLEVVRRRAGAATSAVAALAAALAVAAAMLDAQLALLPAAFILGWLNLVGL